MLGWVVLEKTLMSAFPESGRNSEVQPIGQLIVSLGCCIKASVDFDSYLAKFLVCPFGLGLKEY